MEKLALRIDDIGASTKQFEVYSKIRFGNILFLKYLKPFKAWGPYPEMTIEMWNRILEIIDQHNAFLTVGVTANWVEEDSTLVPFPEKFPNEAKILKEGFKTGRIEIANHGLTHCVIGEHLPRLFTSNRKYHREFWGWIPREKHFEHLEKSQAILKDWLGETITTLIPPGNVYTVDTLNASEKYGIKQINSYLDHNVESKVCIINEDHVDAFHDRELVMNGANWLDEKLTSYNKEKTFVFVKELR